MAMQRLMDKTTEEIVKKVCDEVMPQKAGFDVMEVKLSISLEESIQEPNCLADIQKIVNDVPSSVQQVTFPSDLLQKAKEMSEVYLYTYCAEDALRAFIEAVEKKINPIQLKVSSDLLKKIKERKSLQEKKKWLTPRGFRYFLLRYR